MQSAIYVPEKLKITHAALGIYLSSYNRMLMRQFVKALFGAEVVIYIYIVT